MSETRSLADTKAHLSEVVDVVAREHQRVYITRRGKPEAVVISAEELQSLEETLDLLSTPGAVEEIRRAEKEIAAGDFTGVDQLRQKHGKKR